MGKIVTDFPLTIKIITRDNPRGLKSCLRSIYDDISKNNLGYGVVLIDDSEGLQNRRKNKHLFLRIFGNCSFALHYVGREEYTAALAGTPSKFKKMILSLTGTLGTKEYQPSRAKNASQFIDLDSNYELLVDDDIIMGDGDAQNSVIEEALAKAKTSNSYVSVNLKGFPDISLVQLLERSIINTKAKLHSWNEDNSSYNLSGGFLLYQGSKTLPVFPDLYNEDFLWVAYGVAKNHKKTMKLPLNVIHIPPRVKNLCLDRLAFEAAGEISYATLNEKVIKDLVDHQILPKSDEIELVMDDYRKYVAYVLLLLRRHDQSKILDSDYLGRIDIKECGRTLAQHLEDINRLSYETIQEFFQDWLKRQREWVEARSAFSCYLMQKAVLSNS